MRIRLLPSCTFLIDPAVMVLRCLLVVLLFSQTAAFSQTLQLHGYVRDAATKETLLGVGITVKGENSISQTNAYGFFSLELLADKTYQIIFSSVGYRSDTLNVSARGQKGGIVVYLKSVNFQLGEVVVKGDKESGKLNQISTNTLTSSEIKTMPIIFGEKDPVKAFQFLPGVQPASEGSSMFLVRGGGADQNLLLLDQATVYNANHLFGFISTFNADPIKHVELYKGGFPARYGGRLSSVLDVRMKEGSPQGFHGEGGIGIITSRLTLEGPILKNKVSFMLSARRTYFDAIKFLIPIKSFDVNYNFYDLNGKINWQINPRNSVYLSTYSGADKLTIGDEFKVGVVRSNYDYRMNWGNFTSTLRWNHLFSEKLFSNTSLVLTKYNFAVLDKFSRQVADDRFSSETNYLSSIRDLSVRADFDYFYSLSTTLRWGGAITRHSFNPQILKVDAEPTSSKTINSLEGSVYAEYEANWTEKLSGNLGFRLNAYEVGQKFSWFAEPRAVVSYRLNSTWTAKAAYARTSQFTQQLSNTGVGFPTDLWVPSTAKIPVASAQQLSGALEKNFGSKYALTVESYYKKMTNVVSYRETSPFISASATQESNFWESKLTSGQGWAYGHEF